MITSVHQKKTPFSIALFIKHLSLSYLFIGSLLQSEPVFAQITFPVQFSLADRVDVSSDAWPWVYHGNRTEEIARVERKWGTGNGSCLGSYADGAPAIVRCNVPSYVLAPLYYCPGESRDLHVGEIVVGTLGFATYAISTSDGHNPDSCEKRGVGTSPVRTRSYEMYEAGGRWACPNGFLPVDINGDGNKYGDEEFPHQHNPEACGKYFCPPGSGLAYTPQDPNASTFYAQEGYVCSVSEKYFLQVPHQPQSCKNPDKAGNPCNPATGSKFQSFVDYASSNTHGLIFKRIYLNQTTNSNQFAPGWQHNYGHAMDPASRVIESISSSSVPNITGLQQSNVYNTAESACLYGWGNIKQTAFRGQLALSSVAVQYAGGNICNLKQAGKVVATLSIHLLLPSGVPPILLVPPPQFHRIERGDGSYYIFQQQDNAWQDPYTPEVSLQAQGSGWLFTDANDTQELYDDQGRLQQMMTRQGFVTQLDYDLTSTAGGDDNAETLDKVTGPFGRTLVFKYQDGNLVSVITPDGLIHYGYDALKNLMEVTYPDGSTEIYHYEKTAFPHHLTGITDAKGNRFATWDYDVQGRAILSKHANQNERVVLTYNNDGTTTITDTLGTVSTYHFDWIKGSLKVKRITGERCSSCANGHMKERTYDTNGFLSSYTDWNGNLTTYTRDATGLELSRTEASGTPEARTITTKWHPDFRLPVKVTQAGKVTDYTYDAQGRLLTETTRNTQ